MAGQTANVRTLTAALCPIALKSGRKSAYTKKNSRGVGGTIHPSQVIIPALLMQATPQNTNLRPQCSLKNLSIPPAFPPSKAFTSAKAYPKTPDFGLQCLDWQAE